LSQSSVTLSKTSHAILRRLHPNTKRSIRKALDELSKDPYKGKPLKEELSGLWSLPVSHHRIIYQIEMNAVTVVYIAPRRDVYQHIRELIAKERP
jgi:mRNA-degrading endonuclease RelE of RelBE toxin-antitoxin system